jgi:hypothetical protein
VNHPVTSDDDLLGASHCYDLLNVPILISDYLQREWMSLHRCMSHPRLCDKRVQTPDFNVSPQNPEACLLPESSRIRPSDLLHTLFVLR